MSGGGLTGRSDAFTTMKPLPLGRGGAVWRRDGRTRSAPAASLSPPLVVTLEEKHKQSVSTSADGEDGVEREQAMRQLPYVTEGRRKCVRLGGGGVRGGFQKEACSHRNEKLSTNKEIHQ